MRDSGEIKDREKLLALVLFEIRLLLASELNSTGQAHIRHAAQLAYAVHNDALAILEGHDINLSKTRASIDRVESMIGTPGNTRSNADQFGIGWQT